MTAFSKMIYVISKAFDKTRLLGEIEFLILSIIRGVTSIMIELYISVSVKFFWFKPG